MTPPGRPATTSDQTVMANLGLLTKSLLLVLLFVPVHGPHANVLSVVLSPLLYESEALVRAMVFL